MGRVGASPPPPLPGAGIRSANFCKVRRPVRARGRLRAAASAYPPPSDAAGGLARRRTGDRQHRRPVPPPALPAPGGGFSSGSSSRSRRRAAPGAGTGRAAGAPLPEAAGSRAPAQGTGAAAGAPASPPAPPGAARPRRRDAARVPGREAQPAAERQPLLARVLLVSAPPERPHPPAAAATRLPAAAGAFGGRRGERRGGGAPAAGAARLLAAGGATPRRPRGPPPAPWRAGRAGAGLGRGAGDLVARGSQGPPVWASAASPASRVWEEDGEEEEEPERPRQPPPQQGLGRGRSEAARREVLPRGSTAWIPPPPAAAALPRTAPGFALLINPSCTFSFLSKQLLNSLLYLNRGLTSALDRCHPPRRPQLLRCTDMPYVTRSCTLHRLLCA